MFLPALFFATQGHGFSSYKTGALREAPLFVFTAFFMEYHWGRTPTPLIKPKCEIHIKPGDTRDLRKKNSQYQGCVLALSGSYSISRPLVLRNVLTSRDTGVHDGASRYIGIDVGPNEREQTRQSVVVKTFFSSLENSPVTPATLVLKGDDVPPLILGDESAIKGVAIDPSHLGLDDQGCWPIGFAYRDQLARRSPDLIYQDVNFLNTQCLTNNGDVPARQAPSNSRKKIRSGSGVSDSRKSGNPYKPKSCDKVHGCRPAIEPNRNYDLGHVVSLSAGGGGDDRDNNKKKDRKKRIQGLIAIIEKIHNAQVNGDKQLEDEHRGEFSQLWGSTDEIVQNMFRQQHPGILDRYGL
ncbi:hypothetical protein [Endozoicomonas lisbonensis]